MRDIDRRTALAAVIAAITVPITAARCSVGRGGHLAPSELPVYTWEQLDENYNPDDWTHELTGRWERPTMQPGPGWQRAAFLKGTWKRGVIWVRPK